MRESCQFSIYTYDTMQKKKQWNRYHPGQGWNKKHQIFFSKINGKVEFEEKARISSHRERFQSKLCRLKKANACESERNENKREKRSVEHFQREGKTNSLVPRSGPLVKKENDNEFVKSAQWPIAWSSRQVSWNPSADVTNFFTQAWSFDDMFSYKIEKW